MSCDLGEVTERLENELCSTVYSNVYSSAHSPTFPSLHLRHNSFSNPSVALPTLQLILQPFFRFSYVRNSSLNSPGESPMPYMSPYDYDFFTKVKEPLLGTRYNTRDELIRAIGRSIRNINKDGCADGVRHLPNIWKKIKVHKMLFTLNKAMSDISNCCHYFLPNPCIYIYLNSTWHKNFNKNIIISFDKYYCRDCGKDITF